RIDKLRRLGLTVRVVTTHRLPDIATALEHIGRWLGTEKTAARTATLFRERLAALQKSHVHASPVRVFFQIGTRPAYTINGKSPISAALAVCGGVNVFAALPRIAEPVSAEAILAAQPQVVLYGQSVSRAEINAFWSRLSRVPARANGYIFAVNIDKLTGTPQIIAGIRHVCGLLDRVRSSMPRHK
ncbi:MAG: ABC transporter substrate-binding protein, partial [Sinobacteraceae bacterium]|nr:ABC transporter substrate-binding protein [Nevskiaceae bacterium]